MSRKLLTTACAIDGLLTLLFTQLGMFFVGKAHADATHGVTGKPLVLGLYGGNVAAVALILAVCMLLHGLWCWRSYRAPATQSGPAMFQMILVVAAPLIALVIGVTLATALFTA